MASITHINEQEHDVARTNPLTSMKDLTQGLLTTPKVVADKTLSGVGRLAGVVTSLVPGSKESSPAPAARAAEPVARTESPTPKPAAPKAAACPEGHGQEGPREEGAGCQGARSEGPGQARPAQEGAREEGAREEGTRGEGAGQEGHCSRVAVRQAADQEGTCAGAHQGCRREGCSGQRRRDPRPRPCPGDPDVGEQACRTGSRSGDLDRCRRSERRRSHTGRPGRSARGRAFADVLRP